MHACMSVGKMLYTWHKNLYMTTWVCGLCTHTQSAHTHTWGPWRLPRACPGTLHAACCTFVAVRQKSRGHPGIMLCLSHFLPFVAPCTCGHQLTHTCMHACRPHICWLPFHICSATGQFHVLLDQVHMVPLFLDHSRPRPFHHSWNKIPVENSWKFGRPFCGFCSKCQESEI